MKTLKRNKKHHRKALLIVLGAVVLLATAFGLLELTNRINLIGGQKSTDPFSQNTSSDPYSAKTGLGTTGGDLNTQQSDRGGSAISKSGDDVSQPIKQLLAPEGNFVSNHHPKLSDPSQDLQQSACTTTPGAVCKISLTKDGVTKNLPEKITDAGGSAYWGWSMSETGITKGSWKITATASLDGQTKIAEDALNLEVDD